MTFSSVSDRVRAARLPFPSDPVTVWRETPKVREKPRKLLRFAGKAEEYWVGSPFAISRYRTRLLAAALAAIAAQVTLPPVGGQPVTHYVLALAVLTS